MATLSNSRLPLTLLLSASTLAIGCGRGASPQDLVDALGAALERGDVEAVRGLIDLAHVPAIGQSMLLDLADECSSILRCRISLIESSEAFEAETRTEIESTGMRLEQPIEAVAELTGELREAQEGQSVSMNFKLPIVRGSDGYVFAGGRYPEERLEEMRNTTAEAYADRVLAAGARLPTGGELDSEWLEGAERIPPGGDEPIGAWVERHVRIAAAARGGDPDAFIEVAERMQGMLVGPVDFDGKPVPIERRRLRLQLMALTMLHEIEVKGGYRDDEIAVVILEGRNGVGNLVRGLQYLMRHNGEWLRAGQDLLEIPAQAAGA